MYVFIDSLLNYKNFFFLIINIHSHNLTTEYLYIIYILILFYVNHSRNWIKESYIYIFSSAVDTKTGQKVAIKKLARPFQSAVHAKRTYRELRMLKHMNHENVSTQM